MVRYLEFHRVVGEWSIWHYGHIVFDPLAEVFDHVLVLHPFDIHILFRAKGSSIKHFSALLLRLGGVTGGPTPSTYIRTDSIDTIRYFREGIIQCWDICYDWFFVRRLNIHIWWKKVKAKRSQIQYMSCTQRNHSSSKYASFTPHDLEHKDAERVLQCFWSQIKHDSVYGAHPRGPAVWPPPTVQLHKKLALNLSGWSVPTHGSCQPDLACNRKRQRKKSWLAKRIWQDNPVREYWQNTDEGIEIKSGYNANNTSIL